MNQRMRSQHLFENGQRPSGGQEKPAARKLVALPRNLALQPADRAMRKPSCSIFHASNEFAPFIQRHLLRSMIRLPECVSKSLDQMNPLARKNGRNSLLQ